MKIHRLNPSSVATRFRVPFSSHQVTISSPVDRLVRRARESFVAFEGFGSSSPSTTDHLQVMHADMGWHILRNGNILARVPSLRHASRKVRHAAIHSFIAASPDLLWLHAGAVSRNSRTVLFAGENGTGKSTLVLDLCRRGWSYLSDDVVPLDPRNDSALPFPLTPSVRVDSDSGDRRADVSSSGAKRCSGLPLEHIAHDPAPVSAIILLHFEEGVTTTFERATPEIAEAFLTRQVINHGHRDGGTFEMLTRLTHVCPTWHLHHAGKGDLTDTVLGALEHIPEALAV